MWQRKTEQEIQTDKESENILRFVPTLPLIISLACSLFLLNHARFLELSICLFGILYIGQLFITTTLGKLLLHGVLEWLPHGLHQKTSICKKCHLFQIEESNPACTRCGGILDNPKNYKWMKPKEKNNLEKH